MSKSTETSDKDPFFTLQGSSDSFASRCQNAFTNLDSLEKKHEAFEQSRSGSKESEVMKADPDDEDLESNSSNNFSDSRHRNDSNRSNSRKRARPHSFDYRRDYDQRRNRSNGRGNGNNEFRRPLPGAPRRSNRSVPDFKKNPEKWTCYSLEDVDNGDLSESSNRKAAFEFLAERKMAREEGEEKFEVEGAACSKGAISFSRPNKSAIHKNDTKKGQLATEQKMLFGESADTDADVNPRKSVKDNESDRSDFDDSPQIDPNSDPDNLSVQGSSSFKARKNVRRNIRCQRSDDDLDNE